MATNSQRCRAFCYGSKLLSTPLLPLVPVEDVRLRLGPHTNRENLTSDAPKSQPHPQMIAFWSATGSSFSFRFLLFPSQPRGSGGSGGPLQPDQKNADVG